MGQERRGLADHRSRHAQCRRRCRGDDEARLIETDENLKRADLTQAERDEHLARRAALLKAIETAAHAPQFSKRGQTEGRGNTGGTRDAARKLGMDEKTIRRAEKATGITPEARAVVQQHGFPSARPWRSRRPGPRIR